MKVYPEIEALKSYFDSFSIEISKSNKILRDDLFFVTLSINDHVWEILVEDEYQDFATDNPLVGLFLVFNALECYKETDDILALSRLYRIDPSDRNWLEYYRSLAAVYKEIEKKIDKIDPCISPYDYNLRTGVMQSLVHSNPTDK